MEKITFNITIFIKILKYFPNFNKFTNLLN